MSWVEQPLGEGAREQSGRLPCVSGRRRPPECVSREGMELAREPSLVVGETLCVLTWCYGCSPVSKRSTWSSLSQAPGGMTPRQSITWYVPVAANGEADAIAEGRYVGGAGLLFGRLLFFCVRAFNLRVWRMCNSAGGATVYEIRPAA